MHAICKRDARVSGPSPSKQHEACKTAEDVDIVAYSDILVGLHVRRIYRIKVEKKSVSFFKSNALFGKGREASKFYRTCTHKDAPHFFRFFLLYSGGYYRKLKIVINHEVYPAEGAYLYLWQASTMVGQNGFFRFIEFTIYYIRSCLCAHKNFIPILIYLS